MGKLRTDWQNLLNELDEAIANDQVYICRDLLEHLEPGLKKSSLVKKYFEKNEETLEKIRGDIENITELLEMLNTEKDWILASKNKKVTVYFQKPDGSPFLLTKAETLFECNLSELPTVFVKLVSCFNENDLMPKWFPMGVMKSMETLHQPTKFSKVIQPKIKLQMPISTIIGPRELVAMGKGYDMAERKQMVIAVNRMVTGEKVDDFTVPDVPKGFTRMDMKSAYYFELTRQGIIFKNLMLLDLKAKIVPAPLMNWLSKGAMPNEFMKQLRGRIRKFEGSIWEERVNANPELYEDIKQRLQKCIEKEYGLKTIQLASQQAAAEASSKPKRSLSLRRSMSNMSRGISRTVSLGRKKPETAPAQPEIEEEEPKEEEDEEELNIAQQAATMAIAALSEIADKGRILATKIRPELKERYPIIFEEIEVLQNRYSSKREL